MKSDVNSFIYRCKKWDCKISIHINRENIAKIIDKKNKEQIKYIQKKEHKCKLLVEKSENPINCTTEVEAIKKFKKYY